MLRDIGVACTPGIDFDRERGHATLRLCFAGASADDRREPRAGSSVEAPMTGKIYVGIGGWTTGRGGGSFTRRG